MGSVSLFRLGNIFREFDADRNGKLDRQELAQAAISLLNNPSTQREGSLLATFLQGGTHGNGLMPDFDGDSSLSFSELARFARAGGDRAGVDVDDFRATFPGQVQEGGNTIDMDRLRAIANGTEHNCGEPEAPETPETPEQSNNPGNLLNPMLIMLLTPMLMLFSLFATMFANMLGGQNQNQQI